MRLIWLAGVAACLGVQGCAPYPGGYYGAAPGYGSGVAIGGEPVYAQPGYAQPGYGVPTYAEPSYGYAAPPVYLGGPGRFERDRGRDRERFERERFERERFRERSERERFRPQQQPQPVFQPRPQPTYQPPPRMAQPQPSPRPILPGTPPGQATYPSNNETSRSSP